MIDIHTHPCWLRDEATYGHFEETGKIPAASLEPYFEAIADVDKAVALAFWAPDSRITVSNAFVAEVVRQDPGRIVGIDINPERMPVEVAMRNSMDALRAANDRINEMDHDAIINSTENPVLNRGWLEAYLIRARAQNPDRLPPMPEFERP